VKPTLAARVRRVFLATLGLLILRAGAGLLGWFYLEKAAESLRVELKQELQRTSVSGFPMLIGSPQNCNLAKQFAVGLVELATRHPKESQPPPGVQGGAEISSDASPEWVRVSNLCSVCDWFPNGELPSAEYEEQLRRGISLVGSHMVASRRGLASTVGGKDETAMLLELLRFSECAATARLALRLAAIRVAGEVVGALTILVTEGRLASEASLSQMATNLGSLEPHLPSVAGGIRVEALALAVSIAQLTKEKGERGSFEGLLPSTAVAAYRFRRDESLIRETMSAVDIPDLGALRQAAERIRAQARLAGSEWLVEGLPSLYANRLVQQHLVARFRILCTVVDLELVRIRDGKYPDSAWSDGLREDPFGLGHELRYERKGSGYRLWSVGIPGLNGDLDGKDASLMVEVPNLTQRPSDDAKPVS